MTAQMRPTELRIDGAALAGNVTALKRRLQGKARLMAVVKADAYGHGAADVAKIAIQNGADTLAVATAEEGVALREAGIKSPVLVLGGATPVAARAAVRSHLAQALFDLDTLMVMQTEAALRDSVAHAHLKIDTGMARVGLRGMAALEEMLMALKCCPNVKVEGVFTHFADAVNDPEFTRAQNALFLEAVKRVRAEGYKPVAHAAASAAFLHDETLWHDMVRPGIALYGAEVRWLCPELQTAQTLATRPVRLQWIEPGDTVGYGRTFKAEKRTLVMTLPIGYGDGYPRALGNKAFALVRGHRVPLIGRVCMDMLMVDATNVPGASLDDEVVLMGRQGAENITPDELATLAGTIPYEIMLGFHARVPRRMV